MLSGYAAKHLASVVQARSFAEYDSTELVEVGSG
jgi:hypothetical protein